MKGPAGSSSDSKVLGIRAKTWVGLASACGVSAWGLAACGAPPEGQPESTENSSEALYVELGKRFPRVDPVRGDGIEVCFGTSGFSTEKTWIRSALASTWEAAGAVRFRNWGVCPPSGFKGIRVFITTSGGSMGGLGVGPDGSQNLFINVFTTCPHPREVCVRSIVTHEFGHTLAFYHEYDRPATPPECFPNPSHDGGTELGAWDPASVMMGAQVCATRPYATTLSIGDIVGFHDVYGAPGQRIGTSLPAGSSRAFRLNFNGNRTFDPGTDRENIFGASTDKPVVGAWGNNSSIYISRIGTFRNGTWFLDWNGNGVWDGSSIDRQYAFGSSSHIPVPGRYPRGTSVYPAVIATFSAGTWFVDLNNNGVWNGASADGQFLFRAFASGDQPVVGAWSGGGRDKVGIYNAGNWFLDYNGNYVWDIGDRSSFFNPAGTGSIPVAGDWNNDGKSEIGVYKNGAWYMDYNGNGVWDASGDVVFPSFGGAGETPLVGIW